MAIPEGAMGRGAEYRGYEALLELADKEAGDPSVLGWDADRMRNLLEDLGSPQRTLRCTLVSGSKGKGSTAQLLDAMLRAAGRRTGLYTQPHLHRYAERVVCDGQALESEVSRRGLAEVLRRSRGPVTAFEASTAFALWQFARMGCQEAILEAGFGGAMDATAAADPALVLLGPVEREHTEVFGPCLEDVAAAEAGLLMAGRRCLAGAQSPPVSAVFRARAAETGTPYTEVAPAEGSPGRFVLRTPGGVQVRGALGLGGQYQLDNVALAAAAAEALGCDSAAIRRGAREAHLPGRYETVARCPHVLVDGAHTPGSAAALCRSLRRERPAKTALVVGMLADKDPVGFCQALCPVTDGLWAVGAGDSRGLDPRVISEAAIAAGCGPVAVVDTVEGAVREAAAFVGAGGRVVVCGSFRVVAQARVAFGLAPR